MGQTKNHPKETIVEIPSNPIEDGVIESTLADLRSEWEKDLRLVADTSRSSNWLQSPNNDTFLAVLEDDNGLFYCHRYFKIGEKWNVSVDVNGTDLTDVAFNWAFDQLC